MHNVERRSINDQRSTIEQRSINIRHTKMKKNPVEIFCSIFQTTRLNFLPTVHRGQRTEAKGGRGTTVELWKNRNVREGERGVPTGHRSWYAVPNDSKRIPPRIFNPPRRTVYGLRSTVYGLRSTVYGLRYS